MSKLQDLIDRLCPDGVEYVELSEIGDFYSGLSGKKKEDFNNGNKKFITYMNVFSNLSINLNINEMVKIKDNEKQNKISYGDIIFTGSSEIREECGMTSVVIDKIDEDIYLNSFCFIFRLNKEDILLPKFSKYLFRSKNIRKEIIKTCSGVTRFNISKSKLKKIKIPIPPLEIQSEIVRILDNFTELTTKLTTKLTTELTARKKQYEYYREKLLTFDDDVERIELGKIGYKFYRGNGISRNQLKEDGISCIRYGEIYTTYNIYFDKCVSHTYENEIKSPKYIEKGDILFALTGENVQDIGKSCAYMGSERCLVGGDILVMKHNQNPKYISYALTTYDAIKQKTKGKIKSKVVHTNLQSISKIKIPLPPLEEQQRIVDILDRFDALCNDITKGLPAEIEARQKQYEYYRDKLLTFKEKTTEK